MPRSGSRKLNIVGVVFLWRVSGDGHSRRWRGTSPLVLTLTCQRDDERPGRVMQVQLVGRRLPTEDPDCVGSHRASLSPSEVRRIIVHALKRGWNPSERGPAFVLKPDDDQPELADYFIG